MTPSYPSGDDHFASLIRAYNSMEDPQLRSDFLATLGLTPQGWKERVAAYERTRRSSTNASQEEPTSATEGGAVVVFRVEIRGRQGHRAAPPSRGLAGSGPGRKRLGKGRPAGPQVRIVITWSEE